MHENLKFMVLYKTQVLQRQKMNLRTTLLIADNF